jgi:hypothetical protein
VQGVRCQFVSPVVVKEHGCNREAEIVWTLERNTIDWVRPSYYAGWEFSFASDLVEKLIVSK